MLFLFKSTPENKKESTANTFVGQRGRGGHKEPAELYEVHKELTEWMDCCELKTLKGKTCENDLDLQTHLDSIRSASTEKDGKHLLEQLKKDGYVVSQIVTDDSSDNIQNVMRKAEERYNTVNADILKTALSLESKIRNKRRKRFFNVFFLLSWIWRKFKLFCIFSC